MVFDDTKTSEDMVRRVLMKEIDLPRVELHPLSISDYERIRRSRWIKTIQEEGIDLLGVSSR